MKILLWTKIVGLIMVAFGIFGAMNNYQKIRFHYAKVDYSFLKVDNNLAEKTGSIVRSAEEDSALFRGFQEGIQKEFQELDSGLSLSSFYDRWIVRLGILGLFSSIAFFLAGLMTFLGRRYSLKIACGAIALSCISILFHVVVLGIDNNHGMLAEIKDSIFLIPFMRYPLYDTPIHMLVVNIVLIIMIWISNKLYFTKQSITEE